MKNVFLTVICTLCMVSIWGCASVNGQEMTTALPVTEHVEETTLESTTESEPLKIVESSGEYKKSCVSFDYEEYYRYEQKYKDSRVLESGSVYYCY